MLALFVSCASCEAAAAQTLHPTSHGGLGSPSCDATLGRPSPDKVSDHDTGHAYCPAMIFANMGSLCFQTASMSPCALQACINVVAILGSWPQPGLHGNSCAAAGPRWSIHSGVDRIHKLAYPHQECQLLYFYSDSAGQAQRAGICSSCRPMID